MTSSSFTFWHPVSLLATFFGVGKIRFAPGTFGSLVAYPLLYGAAMLAISLPVVKNNYEVYSRLATLLALLLGFTFLLFVVGIVVSHLYVRYSGKEDPGEVVIDEVVGQSLTLILVLPSVLMAENMMMMFIIAMVGAFLLFRAFDIQKPWPVSWCDERIKGGIGIMLDDIAAALMAVVLYYALLFFTMDIFGWGKHVS